MRGISSRESDRNTALFTDQSEQQMLSTNIVVVHALGLFMRQAEHSSSPLGEAFHLIRHVTFLRVGQLGAAGLPSRDSFYQSLFSGHFNRD